ncbi:MAG: acetyltransferase [Myxococcales bacterium]|nr:acetyltransferase [Myxococcales bacterium]
MSTAPRTLLIAPLLAALAAGAGCVDEVSLNEGPAPEAMKVDETRHVELRFLRVDVKSFSQTLTLEDIRNFPRQILDDTWLLDLNAEPLVFNALTILQQTPTEEAYMLPGPAHNMWKLLTMTPDNIVLDGTSLAPLLGVGKAVAIPPSLILADMIGIEANAPAITTELAARAVLDNVIATHPNAQLRRGLKTADNPEGLYPVTKDSIPVYLADVVDDFKSLPITFGPAAADPNDPNAPRHPGFISSTSGLKAALDDFAMTVTVNLNASPYKGVDLTDSTVGSVNSTASQINEAFDTTNPNWLTLEGLATDLVIPELTMAIYENPAFLPGGTSKEPAMQGDSPVWQLPPWEFERLIMELARSKAGEIPGHCTIYSPQGEVPDPLQAVNVCIDDTAWTEITVDESVILETPPPPPSYFWDILIEVAQVRLHDGGLAEGNANVELTLRDVPVGVTTADLVAAIKGNLAADPAPLTDIAEIINDNAEGDPDFYYYQPKGDHPDDYLYFVAPVDIRTDAYNNAVRPYAYTAPGFFADAALTQKVSDLHDIDGDVVHEKVKIEPGDTLYIKDDEGRKFQIDVGDKPSGHWIALDITRLE